MEEAIITIHILFSDTGQTCSSIFHYRPYYCYGSHFQKTTSGLIEIKQSYFNKIPKNVSTLHL